MVVHPSVHLYVLEWKVPSAPRLGVEGWAGNCVVSPELLARPERQSSVG